MVGGHTSGPWVPSRRQRHQLATDGSVRVSHHDDTTTIALVGEIDMAVGPELRAAVADATLGDHPLRLVIDLTSTTFIDSVAVSAVVLARHAARLVDADFELTSCAPLVARALALGGLPGEPQLAPVS